MRSNCYMCKCKLEDGEQVYSVKTKLKCGDLVFLGVMCEHCNKKAWDDFEAEVLNEKD